MAMINSEKSRKADLKRRCTLIENLNFFVVCKLKVCQTPKRRMAKEMQVVGGMNSTDEGMKKINTRGKWTGLCLFPCNILYLHALCIGMVV